MAGWNTPALYDTRTQSYAPSVPLRSISSGDASGNSVKNHFSTSPTKPSGVIPSSVVNAACKAAQSKGRKLHAVSTKVCRPKDCTMEIAMAMRPMNPPILSRILSDEEESDLEAEQKLLKNERDSFKTQYILGLGYGPTARFS